MKKIVTLVALCCLFSIAAFAQEAAKKTDFSGTWTLDVAKSQLGERSRIEAMTLTVAQTANEIKVSTETKQQATPEGAGGPGMGRGMGRGGFGGGDGTTAYSLDKETTIEVEGPNGKMPMKLKAAVEPGGKATLTQTRTLTMPSGEITVTVKDAWTLSPDGKTLTVVRERSTPRGPNTTTMVFVKKA